MIEHTKDRVGRSVLNKAYIVALKEELILCAGVTADGEHLPFPSPLNRTERVQLMIRYRMQKGDQTEYVFKFNKPPQGSIAPPEASSGCCVSSTRTRP